MKIENFSLEEKTKEIKFSSSNFLSTLPVVRGTPRGNPTRLARITPTPWKNLGADNIDRSLRRNGATRESTLRYYLMKPREMLLREEDNAPNSDGTKGHAVYVHATGMHASTT